MLEFGPIEHPFFYPNQVYIMLMKVPMYSRPPNDTSHPLTPPTRLHHPPADTTYPLTPPTSLDHPPHGPQSSSDAVDEITAGNDGGIPVAEVLVTSSNNIIGSDKPLPRNQRRGAIIILGMLAVARRHIVTERVETPQGRTGSSRQGRSVLRPCRGNVDHHF